MLTLKNECQKLHDSYEYFLYNFQQGIDVKAQFAEDIGNVGPVAMHKK